MKRNIIVAPYSEKVKLKNGDKARIVNRQCTARNQCVYSKKKPKQTKKSLSRQGLLSDSEKKVKNLVINFLQVKTPALGSLSKYYCTLYNI